MTVITTAPVTARCNSVPNAGLESGMKIVIKFKSVAKNSSFNMAGPEYESKMTDNIAMIIQRTEVP